MRMGIMGGTFDPVHNGHLQIAAAAMAECGLDGILLLPAGDPPHKRRSSDKRDRLEMTRLAAANRPGMTVSDIEVLREGTTYTVDTLRQLSSLYPDTEWVYIIGADTVCVLDSWRDFREVAGMCSFAAVGRPDCPSAQTQEAAERIAGAYAASIRLMNTTGPDISSTGIRALVAEGKSVRGLVPEEVEAYIRERGLYLCALTWDELEKNLEARLKPGRMQHTLGVARTACALAERYGVSVWKARLAGLLHDCAKNMAYGDMLRLVRENVPDADDEELSREPVLHAPAGMVMAARDYGVRDPEILMAIRNHTLGGPSMSALEKIVYVADFIEPNRKPFPGLDSVRELAERDLDAAVRLSTQLTQEFVIRRGGVPHPRAMKMLEKL